MSEITQNSYNETDLNQKVVFQKGRDVCDYELNEAQDNLRVLQYRIAQILGGDGVATGIRVTSLGVANQVQVGAGTFNAAGYRGSVSNTLITGLTTPASGSRTDIVYARFRELTVDDPRPLTELGVLSQRKVLSVTFGVAQGGPLPTSTGFPWEGGDYYMGLASIARHASQPIILSSDITQTFTLLPHASLSQMAVYLDGYVNRLRAGAAGIVESPVADMTLDTALATSYSASHSFLLRYGKGHGTENIHSIARNSKVTFGAPFGTKNPLVIRDSVLITDIPFSDDSSGSEQAAGRGLYDGLGRSVTTGYTSRSILRVLNGRASATIGNGTSTFGDFNGATALVNVIAAAISNSATSLHLFVKQGTYVIPSTLTATGLDLVIEGADQSECVFQNTHASQTTLVSTSLLSIKRVTFTATAGATEAIQGNQVTLEDVTLTNMRVSLDGVTKALSRFQRCTLGGAAELPAILFYAQNSASELYLSSCTLTGGAGAAVVWIDPTNTIRQVVFEDCSFTMGRGSNTTWETGLVANTGTAFPATTHSVGRFIFRRCVFTTPAEAAVQVGAQNLPYLEFDGCIFNQGGSNTATTDLSFFRPRANRVRVLGCEFNLGSFITSTLSNEGGAIDLYANHTVEMKSCVVRKGVKEQFTTVGSAGCAVVYLKAGKHLDVDGLDISLTGGAYGSGVVPTEVVYVESDGGATQSAMIRNVRHLKTVGEGTGGVCGRAYLRVAGVFKRAVVEGASIQVTTSSQLPTGTSAILLGGPVGTALTGADGIEVVNCTVNNPVGYAIRDASSTAGAANTIRSCTVACYDGGANDFAIYLSGTAENTCRVIDCNLIHPANVGIYVERPKAMVRGNRILNSSSSVAGIQFAHATPVSWFCFENECMQFGGGLANIKIQSGLLAVGNRRNTRGFDTIEDNMGFVYVFGTFQDTKTMQFNNALLDTY